jgi:hypothetical protein
MIGAIFYTIIMVLGDSTIVQSKTLDNGPHGLKYCRREPFVRGTGPTGCQCYINPNFKGCDKG